MKQIDERDLIFSRMNLKEGSPNYEAYYKENPHRKELDDQLRNSPPMSGPEVKYSHQLYSPMVDGAFALLADLKALNEGEVNQEKVILDPDEAYKQLQSLSRLYHGVHFGVAKLKPEHYYSHRGRLTQHFGEEIAHHHENAIVFAVPLDLPLMKQAPTIPEAIAVTQGYVQAALIGLILSYVIRGLGYDARNHSDGNYLLIAPTVGRDAGLGEIGKNGLLVTKEHGPRIRLGVVSTDMPLDYNKPSNLGLSEICALCGRCADTCPARAITDSFDADACYGKWREFGTDCGLCITNCPFSHGAFSGKELPLQESEIKSILQEFRNEHGRCATDFQSGRGLTNE